MRGLKRHVDKGSVLMNKALYADVIVDISLENLDKPYQYRIPEGFEERIKVGSAVMIPFGLGNRRIKGYVVGIGTEPKYDVTKIKCIREVPEKQVTAAQQLLEIAFWMKERYGCTANEAIKTVMPVKNKVREIKERTVRLAIERDKAKSILAGLRNKSNAAARIRVLEYLIESEDGKIDYSEAIKKLSVSRQTFNSLAKDGVITLESESISRNPNMYRAAHSERHTLTDEQKNAVDIITRDYDNGDRGTYLIHGVTGSGKTEVYMSVIEHVIKMDRQVIVLIPEIALTYQNAGRLYERFGDRVSILNSRMSAGERYDQYKRAESGELDIIIGPRSALFTPFERLGLIIIDEEHENSYKSEMTPRYDAIEVALKRAEAAGASLVLGSATPSVETYYRTTDDYPDPGRIKLLELSKRVPGSCLPVVHVADMREEFKKKNYSIFSADLKEKMQQRLDRNEQIILFINRRGYAGFISCRSCGEPVKCPHCDVSLTLHYERTGSRQGKLICHYCGYESDMVKACPSCGSEYIGGFRQGTQKIQEMVMKEFPDARVLRMDADTTAGKEGHAAVLGRFSKHEADILVGTQMIIKGHDFPKVTLVGILAADTALNTGDYTASEKCFQTLVQAAGRAGRGESAGEVVIQTYRPSHFAILCAAAQDYKTFYNKEISYRRLMGYPPVSFVMSIMLAAGDEELTKTIIEDAAHNIRLYFKNSEGASVIGPAPHSVAKVNDVYRYMLYVKYTDMQELKNLRDKVSEYILRKYGDKKYAVTVDID